MPTTTLASLLAALLMLLLFASCSPEGGHTTTQAPPLAQRTQAELAGECDLGASETCACPEPASTGTRLCIAEEGMAIWTQCGCFDPNGADILVLPPEPEPAICGERMCDPLTEEQTEVSARHCCTEEGACGSQSSFIFGDACVARNSNPPYVPSDQCPDAFPNFLDLAGCCRSDGACGLSVDQVPNWDIGCVERSEMARLINEGSQERDILSLVFFLPVEDAVYEPLACEG
ncbi:MAG: hypothetical protein AAFX99_02210 [Myxococcota bacterium]